MTEDEAIAKVHEAFQCVSRPEQFIRGTCSCDECMEHNDTMASHTPYTITLDELGNPAWDPICAAGDQAFAYYLPAMVRLAFGPDGYIDQLLFHLNVPERVDALNAEQTKALLEALWVLADLKAEALGELDLHRLDEAMRRLEASPTSRHERNDPQS